MQRQFRSDDTSKWSDRFGNGADGAYNPVSSTDAPIDSGCSGTVSTISLTATNAGFAAGQLLLIIQMYGTGHGNWELNKIQSYVAGTITLAYPLQNTYVTGAQVLVMPRYSSGSIGGGVTITMKAWNGTTGGVFAKFSSNAFTIAGSINGLGKGFAGGIRGQKNAGLVSGGTGGNEIQAFVDNRTGSDNVKVAPIGMGGGGGGGNTGGSGGGNTGGGGGGGHANAGINASPQGGIGGASQGLANLTRMYMGGGGGGGGVTPGNPNFEGGVGGIGGAMILIIAKSITITAGSISMTGGNGGERSLADGFSGAGGAGGSVLFKGQDIAIGSGIVVANGGLGGTLGSNPGGPGSVGRIHADYSKTFTGTSSPAIDTFLDKIFNDAVGGFFVNMLD